MMIAALWLAACGSAPRTHAFSEREDDRICRRYVQNSEEGKKATTPEARQKAYDECRQDLIDFKPTGAPASTTTVIINTR
jgi:hypothetical protein